MCVFDDLFLFPWRLPCLLTVLESFQVNADGDTDDNGVTDTVDLLNVLSQFGEACLETHGGSAAHGCDFIPPLDRFCV